MAASEICSICQAVMRALSSCSSSGAICAWARARSGAHAAPLHRPRTMALHERKWAWQSAPVRMAVAAGLWGSGDKRWVGWGVASRRQVCHPWHDLQPLWQPGRAWASMLAKALNCSPRAMPCAGRMTEDNKPVTTAAATNTASLVAYARGATDVPLIEQTIGAFLPTWWPASPSARRW